MTFPITAPKLQYERIMKRGNNRYIQVIEERMCLQLSRRGACMLILVEGLHTQRKYNIRGGEVKAYTENEIFRHFADLVTLGVFSGHDNILVHDTLQNVVVIMHISILALEDIPRVLR